MWPQRRFSPDTLAASASNSSLANTLGQLGGAPAPGHVMFNSRAESAASDSGPANGVLVCCTTHAHLACTKSLPVMQTGRCEAACCSSVA